MGQYIKLPLNNQEKNKCCSPVRYQTQHVYLEPNLQTSKITLHTEITSL